MQLTNRGPTELKYEVTDERISSGLPRLDHMLRGGYHRGSNVLISGAPGTAKSTLAGLFAAAACKRGERTLYVSFDEGAAQIVRNLRSVGIRPRPSLEVRPAQDVFDAHAGTQRRGPVRRAAGEGARAQSSLPGDRSALGAVDQARAPRLGRCGPAVPGLSQGAKGSPS